MAGGYRMGADMNSASDVQRGQTAVVATTNPDVEVLVSGILKPHEWSVVRVPDSRAALSVLKEKLFDLVLISISEEASREEEEALRMIREIQPEDRLLVLAGKGTSADVLAFLQQGRASSFVKRTSSGSVADM